MEELMKYNCKNKTKSQSCYCNVCLCDIYDEKIYDERMVNSCHMVSVIIIIIL